MSSKGNTVFYANLTKADAARLRGLLHDQTVNAYVRALISADLEELGEPPLEPLVYEPRERAPGKPLQHGTLSGYNHYGCRCQACAAARRAYYRHWKKAGACATL